MTERGDSITVRPATRDDAAAIAAMSRALSLSDRLEQFLEGAFRLPAVALLGRSLSP